MSYWRGFINSLGSLFADQKSPDQTMNSVSEPVLSNERIAPKLKGYFNLAQEQISKAIRAEEWGLTEDAIAHYTNAQRILNEGRSARAPSIVSSREQEKLNFYHQKISKWQTQVAERLNVLSKRSELQVGTTAKKVFSSSPQPSYLLANDAKTEDAILRTDPHASAATSVNEKAIVIRVPQLRRTNINTMKQAGGSGKTKPMQEAFRQDDKLVEMINTAIVDRSPSIKWEDVAGLDKAKQTLMEMVILPTKRRDLFTGLRRPAKGLLLFGPPGNGKTMLAKAVASESEATFFNVSASSLTSKWVGEAEKLVRTLFQVAISRQPSVIFMDEIDSIMSTRLANENDASRRLKSEFLIQFDGVTSNPDDLVIVIGATNKPQELDDAVLRRLVKRIYIPLPDENVRRLLLKHQLKGQAFSLPDGDIKKLAEETDGYSGSDLRALCEEAAMIPIRELGPSVLTVKANRVRRLRYSDFQIAMTVIRPSLTKSKWEELEHWNKEFGSN